MDGEREDDEDDREGAQRAVERGAQRPVGQRSGRQCTEGHPDAEEGEHERHRGLAEAHGLGRHGREVGVDGEHTGEAEDGGEQAEDDLTVAEGAELTAYVLVRVHGDLRDEAGERGHRDQADHRDHQEGGAPAEVLSQQGGGGYADDVGHGQAEEHGGDGAGLAPVRHEPGGDDRADAEEGAVRQPGQEASGQQPAEVGGEGGGEVADGEDGHQQQEHPLARDPGAEAGEQRGTEDDADRVRRDEVTGGGYGRSQIVRDVGQQAHHHELGGADAEGAHSEGEQGQGHGGDLSGRGPPVPWRAGWRRSVCGSVGFFAGTGLCTPSEQSLSDVLCPDVNMPLRRGVMWTSLGRSTPAPLRPAGHLERVPHLRQTLGQLPQARSRRRVGRCR